MSMTTELQKFYERKILGHFGQFFVRLEQPSNIQRKKTTDEETGKMNNDLDIRTNCAINKCSDM